MHRFYRTDSTLMQLHVVDVVISLSTMLSHGHACTRVDARQPR